MELILNNLLQPPILFFFLGMLAVWLKSDLDIPQPLPKLFSLYLLLAIGFKGGVKLAESGVSAAVIWAVAAGVFMSFLVPLYAYAILRRRLDPANSAAIAATYGSISAITFLTAANLLMSEQVPYGGHMVAVMALMETPAILVGIILARKYAKEGTADPSPLGHLVREGFTNASVFLLLGSLAVGMLTGSRGWEAMSPFTGQLFQGMLAFFLLDLGIIAARRLGGLWQAGLFPLGFAILFPLANGLLGMGIAYMLDFGMGDAVLFSVLCGSASYIAVPAAIRLAVPEANPSIFVSMALGVTFPFNLFAGIPLYHYLVGTIWGG